ncbi:pyruvate dehydrogenase [acetyl-transferring]-phosphatase 1, mitochondrial-like isoform X2 [Hippocampus zosterae]|uniref:pyruvate dehydrogenase [acetyl-transferring]-phosphatase 1, mitochondrial-like isoform X2 n=1 Tax=Hippocampus zosterae TaxID=109293 RepID=UPI00223D8834|nr:pyruvate dehydrogenase [acetyl-transferring]-phosphatase 1, mitochondrial-like isoform X2 [Hippocampus zosterae]
MLGGGVNLGRRRSLRGLSLFIGRGPPSLPACRRHHPAGGRRSSKYRAAPEVHGEHMSAPDINNILKANEYSQVLPRSPASHGALSFHSNTLASNQPGEDCRSSATCLWEGGGVLFGVFDGHGGPACARAVSRRLFYYIAVATLPLATLAELERAVDEGRAVPPLLEWLKHPRDHRGPNGGRVAFQSLRNYWQERLDGNGDDGDDDQQDDSRLRCALENAFRRLDYDLSVEAQVHASACSQRGRSPAEESNGPSPLRVALSGCTACVAHVQDGILHVANLGDSRAVLGVQEADGRWTAVGLTNDHTADNPDELQRVLGAHPPSERRTAVRHHRLLGLLLPFRAFGDVRFKWRPETLARLYETRPDLREGARALPPPPHYLTPPYLSAEPEVTRRRILPSDKFVVLASDGLWELMHRHTAIQRLAEHLKDLREQKPIITSAGMTLADLRRLLLERKGRVRSDPEDQNSATHLLRHALGDDGYGGVATSRLSKMLSLPPEVARRYRDDITITVIHLNEPHL